ncbi:hypothetical protein [Alicyclobacillus sp. SO9]|uniref:hypothetical protein n=1 Tax=Alicyclobacillus sp. SO9 TaxID=2665646 RepID=UPI0018E85447|nr:hypothetical protein [Alicyclobacillus sp. SO9]QQE81520.1 hypothetical protein GI364_03655 [Alicyclobacillus sp. SO9]
MSSTIVTMIGLMIIPAGIFIYTINAARWMQKKKNMTAAVSAYMLAVISLAASGVVLYRLIAA